MANVNSTIVGESRRTRRRVAACMVLGGLLWGCASEPPPVTGVQVCRDDRCAPAAETFTESALAEALYQLWKRNENTKLTICDALPGGRKCEKKGINFYVQGGPIPGLGAIHSGDLTDISLDQSRGEITSKIKYEANFIGIPTACGKSEVTVSVRSVRDVRIASNDFYCNWLVVGNVLWNGRFAVDLIDFDKALMGGTYSVGGAGFVAGGGGSGRFLFRFKEPGARQARMEEAAPGQEKAVAAASVTESSAPVPTPEPEGGDRRGAVAAAPPAPVPSLAEAAPSTFPLTSMTLRFPKPPERPDDIAVVIGNADYGKLGKDIPNVKPAYADASAFKCYAIEALGVREGNIIDLRDATGAQMVRVFGSANNPRGQLYDWVRAGQSRVHVYYAGHGAPGGVDGGAYLVPSDADGNRIDLNGYPLEVLYRNLGKIPAQSITVVLEACFSGASQAGAVISNASPVFLKPKLATVPPNVTVITAGAANQMASWEEDGSHGLFTKYFLKGMSGEADAELYGMGNGDGRVSLEELDAYLKDTMTYYARRYYGRDQTARIVVGTRP